MNQRHDYQREARPPSAGRYPSREREYESNQWAGYDSRNRRQLQESFEEGRYPRYGNTRPEERYGADDEFPGRTSRFDGSEYEWRGDQGGRGGQEDYWRGNEGDWRMDQDGRNSREYNEQAGFGQPGGRQGMSRPAGYRANSGSMPDRGNGAAMYGSSNTQYGPFAGRGPKGYKRSDDRIREDINEQLTRHPDVDASDIEVQVKDGVVTLGGTVEERHCKRMAEDIAEGIYGVQDVRNEIRVQRSGTDTNRGADQSKSGGMQDRGNTAKSQAHRA